MTDEEQAYEQLVTALRAAIDEGNACDPATDVDGDVSSQQMDEYIEKLVALRAAIAEGLASGVAEDGVFDRVRSRAGIPKLKGSDL